MINNVHINRIYLRHSIWKISFFFHYDIYIVQGIFQPWKFYDFPGPVKWPKAFENLM